MTQPSAPSSPPGHGDRAFGHGSGLWRACWFAGILVAIGVVLVAAGGWIGGSPMALAALVATCCCLVPGAASILVHDRVDRSAGPLAALGVGMFLRTAVPLALGLALHLGAPVLAENHVLLFLLGAYLPALALETLFAIPATTNPQAAPTGMTGGASSLNLPERR